jgi:type VI secretion system secreted protein VgrG
MATITQKHRLVAVATPLGEDVLVFGRMTAHERLGRLFQFDLELFSEDCDIKLTDVLGQTMAVRLELPGERGTRYFHGVVTDFSYQGLNRLRYGVYHATLRPWLWFLTRTADCRIFQNKTAPDIIKGIFAEHGFTDLEDKLSGSYRPWEYCVQYRETDFNFVSRLMEQEGCYYYFKHEKDKHILVLADGYSAHQKFKGYAQVPYFPPDAHDHRERYHLSELNLQVSHQPGAYALNDFDFKAPSKQLLTKLSLPKNHAQADFEIYDYPGEYTEYGHGESYTRIRLEELLAQHESVEAKGNAAGLAVGYLFDLTGCPRQDLNREYLIESATHLVESDAYESVAGFGGAGKLYRGEYVLLDARQHYRAPRITSKPVVQGPQTAIVVGPRGEEIYTDQYGRVKVQFHWDREGKDDENSSCWIRVAHPWAGTGYGMIANPRIGQEVVVDFLEGDPDQPLITGRVYNQVQKVPYELPKYQAYTTIKSRTTKDGGVRDFNELRFDDRKGKEQVFIHAQRRMDIRVKRNKYETVQGSSNTLIGGGHALTVGGAFDLHVRDNIYARSEGEIDLSCARDLLVDVGGSAKVYAHGKMDVNANKITITAETMITLKVGGSFIEINPGGITIQGPLVRINCGGSAAGLGPLTITDPLDAAAADNGTPGYLDQLRLRGGAAGGGRRTRSVAAQNGDTAPFGPFARQDDAARAALNSANPRSIAENREYVGMIYQDPATGQFFATNPQPVGLAGGNLPTGAIPPGNTETGFYHTHGNYSLADGTPTDAAHDAFDSENFSGTDINTANSRAGGNPNYRSYLATPSGSQQVHNPSTGAIGPL